MFTFKLLERITYNSKKILYIDGLRFIAVSSVFFAHFLDYYTDNNTYFNKKFNVSKYENISSVGVFLFFSISGFIIALPFIQQQVYNNNKISIKNYFVRRLTRLEPPYIILLSIFFIFQVSILQTKNFDEIFPHYLASLLYVHNIVYNEMPLINPVLWSLEIEIQFYILAPIFALVFKSDKILRRIILFVFIFFWKYINFINFEFRNLLDYLPFFLVGFLAADLYLEYKDVIKKSIIIDFLCISSIILIFIYPNGEFLLFASLILLVLSSKSLYLIKFLEKKFIYIVGGMCYSIYMLHQKLIYLVSAIFPKTFFVNYWIDFSLKLFVITLIVLFVSSVFFIFIERPTMKKDWWKYKSFKKLFFE